MSYVRLAWRPLLACLIVALAVVGRDLAAPAAAQQGGYAPSFELTGIVDNPRTFTLADLQAYPSITLTAAFGAGGGFDVGTFTGVNVWELLREARVQVDPARNNDLNRKYLVATGSDGYEAIFSLAEVMVAK